MASHLVLDISHDGAEYICKEISSFSITNQGDDLTSRLMVIGKLQNFPNTTLRGNVTLVLRMYIGAKLIRSLAFHTDSLDIKRGDEEHLLSCWVPAIELKTYFGEELHELTT